MLVEIRHLKMTDKVSGTGDSTGVEKLSYLSIPQVAGVLQNRLFVLFGQSLEPIQALPILP